MVIFIINYKFKIQNKASQLSLQDNLICKWDSPINDSQQVWQNLVIVKQFANYYFLFKLQ